MRKGRGRMGIRIDWRSLRTRGLLAVGAVSLSAGAAWVGTSLDAAGAAREDLARARVAGAARALARSFEVDGLVDRAETGSELSELARSVALDLVPGATVRILRPDESVSPLVALAPHQAQSAAFRTIGTSLEGDPVSSLDYLPAMDPALSAGREVVLLQGEQAVAYAPVRDEWNHALALVRVAEPFGRSFWRAFGDLLLRLAGALAGAFLLVAAADLALRRHTSALQDLARGFAGQVLERRCLSDDVRALALTLADPRTRTPDIEAAPEDELSAPTPGAGRAAEKRPARVATPKRQIFDPRNLLDRAALAFRARAAEKDIEIALQVGPDVPSRLIGSPRALLAALHALLENAVSYTRRGSIQLRVTRVLERPEFRFEVADTGVGVPWQAQPPLDEILRQAAGRDPREFPSGLGRASSIAARLGGELGFESQPGAGSRFFFTACCEPVESAPLALSA